MDSKKPLISIIIPTYNAEQYIETTIHSVQHQTFDNWELIVIDDGSQDSTCSIVERIIADDSRIRLVRNETNMGVADTRNRGSELCNGKYIAFLDADDIWYPDKLACQFELAEKDCADIVYSSYDIINANGNKIKDSYIAPKTVSYEELLKENVIGCSSVIINSSVFEKYRFDSKFYHEDYVMWLQILANGGKAVGCTQVLTAWRYIENSRSFNKRCAAKERWIIYRDFCKLPIMKRIQLMYEYAKAALKKYK